MTHDLGVVADIADKISVMYARSIMEQAAVGVVFANPSRPYALGLLESNPRVDLTGQELASIKGLPPNPMDIPAGCEFSPGSFVPRSPSPGPRRPQQVGARCPELRLPAPDCGWFGLE